MGGQGGCEWRTEAFVKIKKILWGGGVGVRSGGVGLGGQSGCEWRSEAFVKIKKNGGRGVGSGWGVRVDGNGELKLL